jgi:dipeptidase E
VPATPTIVAFGGHDMSPGSPLNEYLVGLTEAERPRVLFIGTASGDSDLYIARFHDAFRPPAEVRHLRLFGIPPPSLRDLVLDQDLIFVGGGNTASMLAVWRLHGLDRFVREAWEAGTVLAGTSAGAICWFDAGVTDSFRVELDGLDCLGFLPGSCCPHYDGEENRRPAYHRLVAGGLPAGYAADDLCGLVFRGSELTEVVTAQAGAGAYRVELVEGEVRETPIEARELPSKE